MGTRMTLQKRLAVEFDDVALAAAVVQRLSDESIAAVSAMCGGAIATSPSLSYRPAKLPGDRVEAVIAFSYGYRLADTISRRVRHIPRMDALLPGPVNEQLATGIAAFVAVRPVPVIAQWEIAQVLGTLGTSNVVTVNVIAVEPDTAEDGTTVYLSTAGVLDKGLRLAAQDGIRPQRVGVFAHVDHAPRCVATARASNLDAALIADVDLPDTYDPQSGQLWTRDRVTWIATDLFARTRLAASTEWNPAA